MPAEIAKRAFEVASSPPCARVTLCKIRGVRGDATRLHRLSTSSRLGSPRWLLGADVEQHGGAIPAIIGGANGGA